MRAAWFAALAVGSLVAACDPELPETGSSLPPPDAGASDGTFNAGSGTLLPDGKTIVYHIPDGTGGNDWNPESNPIRAKRGMTVRLIDDDTTAAHWLHTYGEPCDHGTRLIGTGYDCVIKADAPLGISTTAEHNILNGIGYLYIDVVE